MDYARRSRMKIWGTARIVDDDPHLIRRLEPDSYAAESEQAILFTVKALDINCTSHIPQLVPADQAAKAIEQLQSRIRELEEDKAALLQQLATRAP